MIVTIPIGPVCFVAAFIVIAIGVHLHIKGKRKKAEADEAARQHALHAPHRAWALQVHHTLELYDVAQLPAPPEVLGGEDASFINAAQRYERAKEQATAAANILQQAVEADDPFAKRTILKDGWHQVAKAAPNEAQQAAKKQILEISNQQAATLWEKVQHGDDTDTCRTALSELIAYTEPKGYTTYGYFTGRAFVEPEGWLDAVSEFFRSPTFATLRIEPVDEGELLLLAQSAIDRASIIDAKIVLAHWRVGGTYRSLIPMQLIERLNKLVLDHHNAHDTTHPTLRKED